MKQTMLFHCGDGIRGFGVLACFAKLLALTALALLSGCEFIACSTMINCFDPLGRAYLPPPVAYLELKTPNYMDAHIHSIEKELSNGTTIRSSESKIIETHMPDRLANGWTPPSLIEKTPSFSWSSGLSDSPVKLTVEWTSLAERKTYRSVIQLNLSTRRQITSEVETSCVRNERPVLSKRNIITLELAPGGKVKGWLSGICLPAMEIVMKQRVTTFRKGTTGRASQALRDYNPEPMNMYIKKHGIPYSSW